MDLRARHARTEVMRGAALSIGLAALLSGCGSGGLSPAPTRAAGAVNVSCAPERGLAAAPLPGEVGVYRAGPLMLVTDEDLGQLPARVLVQPSGTEAIAVLTGTRAAALSVDQRSRGRFSLQFTPLFPGHPYAVISDGRAAVRFPACGQRLHRFGGGILFVGKGCARLQVRAAGQAPIPMLIPIGNTLRGCRGASVERRLTLAALPFLGVACHVPNSMACDRVGIGVHLDRSRQAQNPPPGGL